MPKSLAEQLGRVFVDPESGCHKWLGCRTRKGYGQITYRGHRIETHRAMWLLHNGDIPQGMFVLHKCDVRNCIAPQHLYLGTAADNTGDMMSKGRGRGQYTPQDTCRRGHTRDAENLYIYPYGRVCKICRAQENTNGTN